MKEATGEMNMTVITIIAVGAILAFFILKAFVQEKVSPKTPITITRNIIKKKKLNIPPKASFMQTSYYYPLYVDRFVHCALIVF